MFVVVSAFFFFQAEDGIRDTSVTGVQTCALPIFLSHGKPENERPGTRLRRQGKSHPHTLQVGTGQPRHSITLVIYGYGNRALQGYLTRADFSPRGRTPKTRSEERR